MQPAYCFFFFVEVGVITMVCSSTSYSMVILYLWLYLFQGHASAHSILITDKGEYKQRRDFPSRFSSQYYQDGEVLWCPPHCWNLVTWRNDHDSSWVRSWQWCALCYVKLHDKTNNVTNKILQFTIKSTLYILSPACFGLCDQLQEK